MKIGTKLVASFCGVSAICAAVGAMGYWGLNDLSHHVEEIGVVRLPSVESLQIIETQCERITAANRTLAIPDLPTEIRERQWQNIADARETYQAAWKIYEPLPQTPEEATLWKEFVPAWQTWREANNKYHELCRKVEETGLPDATLLAMQIEKFTKDHYILVQKVLHQLHEGQAHEGGNDPTACNFGRWMRGFQSQSARLNALLRALDEPHRQFHEAVGEIQSLCAQGRSEEALATYRQRMIPNMNKVFEQFQGIADLAQEAQEARRAANEQLHGPVVTANRTAADLLRKLVQLNSDVAKVEVKEGLATALSLELTSIVIVLVGVLVSITLGVFISIGIRKAIANIVTRLKDIAQGEGDLTQRVDEARKDELGELGKWFNTFVKKVHDIIAEVAQATREVASAATEIASSSEEMATGMKEQAGQVTQISSAVEEMSQSVVEVARKSAEASSSAGAAGQTAQSGGKVVEETIAGMQAISQAVSDGAASVTELGKRSEQIGQIVETINDIADQTNLLALNAAIEAARAGEHGRGFAVVADEVRKLADRTTKATEEIAHSIRAIQGETTQAVNKMNSGTEQVKLGVEKATAAGASLQSIVTAAQGVADMIRSIAAAAEEQSAASEQISKNIESVNAVSKQASEGAGQAAAAASQLSSKAEQLQRLVGQFKLAA